jgi:hypothetical protein
VQADTDERHQVRLSSLSPAFPTTKVFGDAIFVTG